MAENDYRQSAYDEQGRYQPSLNDFLPTGQPRSIRSARGGYRAPGFFGFGGEMPAVQQPAVTPDTPAPAALRSLFASRSTDDGSDSRSEGPAYGREGTPQELALGLASVAPPGLTSLAGMVGLANAFPDETREISWDDVGAYLTGQPISQPASLAPVDPNAPSDPYSGGPTAAPDPDREGGAGGPGAPGGGGTDTSQAGNTGDASSESPGMYRKGGFIKPDGDKKFEKRPITAHEGEYVVRPEAVKATGVAALHKINARRPSFPAKGNPAKGGDAKGAMRR